MLPTLVDEPPTGEAWQHEIKFDGYRTQIVIEAGEVRAFSRRGHDWSDRYPKIVSAARDLACEDAIIDGEVIIQNEGGRSDYHALRSTLARRKRGNFVFMAFDLLHLNGKDLRRQPLEVRRSRLRDLLGEADPGQPLHYSDELVGNGVEVFAAADRMGLEGIVSKKLGSQYRSGPARNWLKTKTLAEDEFVVIGTSKGDRAPVALLAREEEAGLTYVGAAMVTLPQPQRDQFWEAIDRIRTPKPPIPMEARKETGWAKPLMRVRARFLRGEEMLRHATVTALTELPASKAARTSSARSSREPPLPNPHLDRVALAAYYEAITPALLAWIARRPLNMVRCSGYKCWFQRNLTHPAAEPGTFGPAIKRIPILQKNGRTEEYLFIENAEGVRQCVEADAVEFHGWGSRVDDVERPDRLVIDLDPDEGLGFEHVREAAFLVRDAFRSIGLSSFPMLSGGKGIHVIVPTEPSGNWAAVRTFARSFCGALADAQPDRFTVALPKAERRGRIFLDYLRNQRTSTAVLPYSVRAREGAPVAVPVTWSELPKFDRANGFSIRDVKKLLRRAASTKLAGWGVAEQSLPV